MSLAEEYRRQHRFRAWDAVLDALPPLAHCRVLDLGCAIGDQSAALAARGARVLGVDLDDDLLQVARSRNIPDAAFVLDDLRRVDLPAAGFDGIWCSFAAAYIPDLADALARWRRWLRPGGWIALTEVDDLFAHHPLDARTRLLLADYAARALRATTYDFHMGRKLATHLRAAGFTIARTLDVADRELAFSGPAAPEIAVAWRERLDRMRGLQDFCGPEFPRLRDAVLACLARADHVSDCTVRFVLGNA